MARDMRAVAASTRTISAAAAQRDLLRTLPAFTGLDVWLLPKSGGVLLPQNGGIPVRVCQINGVTGLLLG